MKPLECIDSLKQRYVNTDIDWEMVLEHGYRRFLGPDSVVIDIGGHAGRHTEVFVRGIGCARVLVFEPLPHQCERLRERYRDCDGVEIFEVALGLEGGETEFVFNTNSPEESGLKERVYNDPDGRNLEILRVARATLDEWTERVERVDYVKIDTEGGEVDIIRGARELIARHRPILSIEYGASSYEAYGHTRDTLFDLMHELDYGLFDLFGQPLATRDEWRACCDNYYWDFYGVAREASASFAARLEGVLDLIPHCLTRPAAG